MLKTYTCASDDIHISLKALIVIVVKHSVLDGGDAVLLLMIITTSSLEFLVK